MIHFEAASFPTLRSLTTPAVSIEGSPAQHFPTRSVPLPTHRTPQGASALSVEGFGQAISQRDRQR